MRFWDAAVVLIKTSTGTWEVARVEPLRTWLPPNTLIELFSRQ